MSVPLLKRYLMEVLGGANPSSAGKDLHGGNLYSMGYLQGDAPIRRTGGNVLDDESTAQAEDLQGKLHAACCLILRKDGRVLAVSRKDDPTAMGLPGGKVDPGEQPIEAAARELEEETGLIASDLHHVFTHQEDDGYTTHTFVCRVDGEIDTDEAGVVKWVTPQTLFNGPFGSYNRALWDALGLPTE